MNTLENAFLDALATDLRIDTEPVQVAQAGRKVPTVAEMIGTPEQILEPAKPETAAAVAKGMAQGFVGLPGDLIALARGVYDLAKSGGDLEAFVKGLESATGLPTTEDIKKFLDEAGLKVGDGDMTAETVGEFAAPGGYVKGAKAAAKAVKGAAQKVTSTPPRGSIKLAPDLEVEIAPAERSKNFKNWFGNSKVIDEKGKPFVVYHGTSRSFDTFKTKDGAFFTGDEGWANYHAQKSIEFRGGKGEERVVPVYLKMENPLVLDGKSAEVDKDYINNYMSFQKQAKKLGHDGLIIKNSEGGTEYVVFKPTQIKSAIGNVGTFDPKDPNILRGAIAAPVGAAATQNEESK